MAAVLKYAPSARLQLSPIIKIYFFNEHMLLPAKVPFFKLFERSRLFESGLTSKNNRYGILDFIQNVLSAQQRITRVNNVVSLYGQEKNKRSAFSRRSFSNMI